MKRIVVHVFPEGPQSTPEDESASRGETVDSAAADESRPQRDYLRVEAILSDAQAQQLMGMLVRNGPDGDPQMMLDEMLRKQVDLAGPQAADLFDRIVLSVERQLITQVFTDCERVKTRAAARLGIDRNTLHKKLRKYELIEDDADEKRS